MTKMGLHKRINLRAKLYKKIAPQNNPSLKPLFNGLISRVDVIGASFVLPARRTLAWHYGRLYGKSIMDFVNPVMNKIPRSKAV